MVQRQEQIADVIFVRINSSSQCFVAGVDVLNRKHYCLRERCRAARKYYLRRLVFIDRFKREKFFACCFSFFDHLIEILFDADKIDIRIFAFYCFDLVFQNLAVKHQRDLAFADRIIEIIVFPVFVKSDAQTDIVHDGNVSYHPGK